MAFDAELDSAYYDAIKPAIAEAGYDPICLKDQLPKDDICDVMLAEIRKAQFIVADFTKQRGGVYFEAGFAKALGKDVFWTCREDDFGGLHFDTNHYGHVKWLQPADLKQQLKDWIIAELGFGPHRALGATP
jgi:nucleoside 2-deoxyribosyltransferase